MAHISYIYILCVYILYIYRKNNNKKIKCVLFVVTCHPILQELNCIIILIGCNWFYADDEIKKLFTRTENCSKIKQLFSQG